MLPPTHTWKTFKAHIDDLTAAGQSLLFRGQSNASWGLVSTYHRLAAPGEPQLYWQVLRTVHDYVSTWTGKSWNLNDAIDLASFVGFLQHNGFPTPLLDWSRSPYAAAYFAFEGVNDTDPQSDHVAVFAFDSIRWSQEWQPVYDVRESAAHVSVLATESRGNHKQILQQGTYTFSTVRDQQAHIVAHQAAKQGDDSSHPGYLTKLTLSVSEKPLVMRDLALMGISAMTLFPGVEGLCKHLREVLFPVPVIGLTPSQRTAALMQSLNRLREDHNLTEPSTASGAIPQGGEAESPSVSAT